MDTVESSLAGPRRPQDRVALTDMQPSFRQALADMVGVDHELVATARPTGARTPTTRRTPSLSRPATRRTRTSPFGARPPRVRATPPTTPSRSRRATPRAGAADVTNEGDGDPTSGGEPEAEEPEAEPSGTVTVTVDGEELYLKHGSAVIAAITSCTNTSNPSVMMGAGLLAKKAVEKGLTVAPHVKTSLAPGSKVVTEYLQTSGLLDPLEQAQVRRRRLRVHDLHRELGAAGRGDLRRRRGERPGRRRRPLGQPQLRGSHQPGRAGQLPGLAAARGRLRPGRARWT